MDALFEAGVAWDAIDEMVDTLAWEEHVAGGPAVIIAALAEGARRLTTDLVDPVGHAYIRFADDFRQALCDSEYLASFTDLDHRRTA